MPETWYAHPNDLIGGWSVMNRDHPPSGLNRRVDPDGREVATFMSEADARRIVELHNADRRPILIYNSYGAEDRWPAREGWRLDPNSVADTREQVERYIAMYPEIEHRLIWREIREWSDGSSWTDPWVAVDQEATDEPA